MKQILTEKFLENVEVEVFPVTLVKFLLNKRKILNYFEKALDPNFELKIKYSVQPDDCQVCESKKHLGMLCRQHTSIHRVINANNLLKDLDTDTFFYKNEIFKMVGKKLVIVYCPHPKLIKGDITDAKVRKINPITIEDPELPELPQYRTVKEFLSTHLMEQHLRCWFNNQFSLVTIPESRNYANFCLVPNQ